jgi:hypothetical protein
MEFEVNPEVRILKGSLSGSIRAKLIERDLLEDEERI